MTIAELTTPYIRRKVLMYASNGNTVVVRAKDMRKVGGNVYAGRLESDGYGREYCNVYIVFDGVENGIKLFNTAADKDVEDILRWIRDNKLDTPKNFGDRAKEIIKKGDRPTLAEIQFVNQFRPDLTPALIEARRLYDERREQESAKRKAQKEEKDRAYVKEMNDIAAAKINEAIQVLRNNGVLKNEDVTVYRGRYDSSTYAVVNYICRQYGVKLPLRTAGWVNDSLATLQIEDGKCTSLQYYRRKKNARPSEVIYRYINLLIEAVRRDSHVDNNLSESD